MGSFESLIYHIVPSKSAEPYRLLSKTFKQKGLFCDDMKQLSLINDCYFDRDFYKMKAGIRFGCRQFYSLLRELNGNCCFTDKLGDFGLFAGGCFGIFFCDVVQSIDCV